MRKIFLFFLLVTFSFSFNFNEWKKNKMNDFIIVETNFKNSTSIFTDDLVITKVYKDNVEIKGVTLFSNSIFRAEEGTYRIESYFENQYFEKTIYKSPYSHSIVTFTFKLDRHMEYFDFFNRTSVFIIFIFNIILYAATIKLVKRNSFLLNLTFVFLIIFNFLDFINIFDKIQYFILEIISFAGINFLFMLCSFKFINIKKEKFLKYIFIFMTLNFLLLSSVIFLIFPSIQIYLLEYNKVLFRVFAHSMTLLSYIVEYSIILIPTIYLFLEWRKSKGRLKVLTIYQILFLLLFLILEVLLEFIDIDIFSTNNILDNIKISVFYWIIYFNLNIDSILKYFKNIEFFTVYTFKYVVIIQVIYIYSVITTQYNLLLPVIITSLIGDFIYILIKYIINISKFEFSTLLRKIKGIDNIETFENIIEKELAKKENIQKTIFKIFIEEHEKYNYIINDDNKLILAKKDLKDEFKEFHFGIETKINNKCIGLLLIKCDSEKHINEEKIYYKEILEELTDYIIYVRTLHLKRKLSNEHEKSFINQINEEEIQLIREFATHINNETADNKIKLYSKIIIEKSEKLGESDV